MITSKTKNENYLGYLTLEIIMVTVVTFLGSAFIVFYVLGKSDSRRKTQNLEYLFNHPYIFGFICILPALLAIGFLLYFRNRNYIVGYLFNQTSKQLVISYRKILTKTKYTINLTYDEIEIKDFNEKKILFNQAYKGKRIIDTVTDLNLDFVVNNFIWEEQAREKIHFLREINRISNTQNSIPEPSQDLASRKR